MGKNGDPLTGWTKEEVSEQTGCMQFSNYWYYSQLAAYVMQLVAVFK